MGVLLLLPFFLLRFGLLACLDRTAVGRAAHFAPMYGLEQAACWVYQFSNAAILVCILLAKVQRFPPLLFCGGLALYALGLLLLALSVIAFASPSEEGINQGGVYRFSRNPMYVAYFLYFLGCALLGQSWLLAVFTLIFQLSAHWIILAEERWCIQRFGDAYIQYMKTVRRYFGVPAETPPEEIL